MHITIHTDRCTYTYRYSVALPPYEQVKSNRSVINKKSFVSFYAEQCNDNLRDDLIVDDIVHPSRSRDLQNQWTTKLDFQRWFT